MDLLCYSCLVFVMLSRLFTAAFWAPAGKGLTSWVFVTFPCGTLGHVWYLIVSIPDLCRLSYFVKLAWRLHNLCNISSHGNNQIKLAYCDETKKIILHSQTV